jgi:hypothetical protein
VTASVTTAAADSLAAPALFCPACGYDLRAIDSDRCPECGLLIDRTAAGQSTLPWSHRHRLGYLGGYGRTCLLVCFRPQHFRAEMDRPVSLGDARAFRRATVWVAYLPLAAVVIAVYIATFAPPTGWRPLIEAVSGFVPSALEPLVIARPTGAFRSVGYAMELFVLAALLLAIWLWFLAAAGVASYWFHPRHLPVERQNRAVALSYYACAPLAMMPITVTLLVASALLDLTEVTSAAWRTAAHIAVLVAVSFQLSGWWFTTLLMLPMTTRCGTIRATVYFLTLPLTWMLLGVWIVGGILTSAVLIAVIVVTTAS